MSKKKKKFKWNGILELEKKKRSKETCTTVTCKKGRELLYGCNRYNEVETYMSNKEKLENNGISVKDCSNERWP